MGCGCGKKFTPRTSSTTARTGVQVTAMAQTAAATGSRTVVQSAGVTFGKAPNIQPMQRKTV